jgi:cyclic dehypoxanthinyl futalosine synthase
MLALPERIASGERLTPGEGLGLLKTSDHAALGAAADETRRILHPETRGLCTFVIDRNINYTNVCVARCGFCNFYRLPGHEEGYVQTIDQVCARIDQLVSLGGTQVLMQGGHNPRLGIDYYKDLLRGIKQRFPGITLHCFSPSEIDYFSQLFHMTYEEVLKEFRSAGLDSVPGGGGEILVDRVRRTIAPGKAMSDEWLGVMRAAHRIGMRSTATMMFGHVETLAERVAHLQRIRELQDETQGFTAFIPWSYQPDGTELGGSRASAVEYLKVLALARLYLDNVPNIQAGWLTEGPKVAQMALLYGANDFGGTLLEENVVSQAGGRYWLGIEEIFRLIRDVGRTPAQRDTYYRILKVFGPGEEQALVGRARAIARPGDAPVSSPPLSASAGTACPPASRTRTPSRARP